MRNPQFYASGKSPMHESGYMFTRSKFIDVHIPHRSQAQFELVKLDDFHTLVLDHFISFTLIPQSSQNLLVVGL